MSDKLQSTAQPRFALRDIAIVTLRGRDCIAFAQAQFMSDIGALGDAQWQWSGWLTPKGRVVALFAVLRLDAERIDLLVLDADATALATSLKRYVFRSKVAIEVRADLQVGGAFAAPARAQAAIAEVDAHGITLDFGTGDTPRALSIVAREMPVPDDPQALAEWRRVDLAHGLPRLDERQRELWTPQQLSLERLRAFSVSKGCYPGQEIVARTHFLGQAKRGAAAFTGVSGAAPGQALSLDGQAVGRVVSTAGDFLLGVVPSEHATATLEVDGGLVEPVPLRGGLAR